MVCIFFGYEVYISIIQDWDIYERGSYELEFEKIELTNCNEYILKDGYRFITNPLQMYRFLQDSECKKDKLINYLKENVIVIQGHDVKRIWARPISYWFGVTDEKKVGTSMIVIKKKDFSKSRIDTGRTKFINVNEGENFFVIKEE